MDKLLLHHQHSKNLGSRTAAPASISGTFFQMEYFQNVLITLHFIHFP